MDTSESLNYLLVNIFNDAMNIEHKALITNEFKDITVTDMHIIDAIGTSHPRTMTEISKTLKVTMGTLTIGMNALVRKGYVIRTRGEKDKRTVYASLTPKGVHAYNNHKYYHECMVAYIMNNLEEKECLSLIKALNKLDEFFIKWK